MPLMAPQSAISSAPPQKNAMPPRKSLRLSTLRSSSLNAFQIARTRQTKPAIPKILPRGSNQENAAKSMTSIPIAMRAAWSGNESASSISSASESRCSSYSSPSSRWSSRRLLEQTVLFFVEARSFLQPNLLLIEMLSLVERLAARILLTLPFGEVATPAVYLFSSVLHCPAALASG